MSVQEPQTNAFRRRRCRVTKRTIACDCGRMKQRYSQSCNACARKRQAALSLNMGMLKHGHASDRRLSSEYACWLAIKQRCLNPSNPAHKDYGARGIRICDEWRADFDRFLKDVGCRPSLEHSIDRIDNDGHYEPTNVRWATKSEQQLNRRVSLRLRGLNNKSLSLQQVAYALCMTYSQCRTAFVRAGIIPRRPSDPKHLRHAQSTSA